MTNTSGNRRRSYRSLRDGTILDTVSQAFHARLPSLGPSGTICSKYTKEALKKMLFAQAGAASDRCALADDDTWSHRVTAHHTRHD
jgi:hypothetical protein